MEVFQISFPIKDKDYSPVVLAIGYFDGVHLGHQQVLNNAAKIANERGLLCGVMTFDPHPKEVINDNIQIDKITPLEDKLKEFEKSNVDICYVVDFTKEFAMISSKEFIESFLVKLNVEGIVVGFDFRFGNMGTGNGETLQAESDGRFSVDIVEPYFSNEEKISSTRIREYLLTGMIEEANSLLGRSYSFIGKVVTGDKRGRTIGYPTANIEFIDSYINLKNGVYVVNVKLDNSTYIGVMNVGYKPTFHHELKKVSYEIYILDFDQVIYERLLGVEVIDYIREEKKFSSIDELKIQITNDIGYAKARIANIS